jgi:hypothetical protein
MVHLWSQWWVIKLLVTLRLSSVRLYSLIAPTGWSGPGCWLGTRLVSEEGPEESDYPLYTLPLISWHTYIRHWHHLTILALAWQLTPNEVITLKVKMITLKNFLFGRNYSLLSLRLRKAEKVLMWSDHNNEFEKEKYFVRKYFLSSRSRFVKYGSR